MTEERQQRSVTSTVFFGYVCACSESTLDFRFLLRNIMEWIVLLFYLYPVLSNRARYSHFALFILYKKKQGFEIFFLSLLCSTWGHYCILPVFFVPASFVKECTDLLMSKSKSLLIVFVAYHHNANVNPRGYNEFISRFCVYLYYSITM